MNLRVLLFRIFTLAAVYSCFVAAGSAQIVSGSITGSVTDPSGSAVAGANVTVVNTSTGAESPATTTGSGYFSVANLIAGTYRVDVAAPGFKGETRPDIPLSIGSVVTLEFQLQVGNVQEKIVVTGEAPLLQTEQVSVGSTLTSQTLVALPTEGRNPTALAIGRARRHHEYESGRYTKRTEFRFLFVPGEWSARAVESPAPGRRR